MWCSTRWPASRGRVAAAAAPAGRFIEIGKTDIRDPARVAADHPGVAYQAFDLMAAGPDRSGEILAELVTLFERGALRPLPVAVHDIRLAPQAFRVLAQAQHIGKLVLPLARPLDPGGTVLVTGGTGMLGGLVARHLVARYGVRHLVLVSRQGRRRRGWRVWWVSWRRRVRLCGWWRVMWVIVGGAGAGGRGRRGASADGCGACGGCS